jgi:hypothetical protein
MTVGDRATMFLPNDGLSPPAVNQVNRDMSSPLAFAGDEIFPAKPEAVIDLATRGLVVTLRVTATTAQQAASAGWFLSTDDKWAGKFFDPKDLHSVDRELFGN